ncbi:MAG TPA: DUF11 domain-containing protein [Isosphaeraceae bacterium]|jgi:uncharacterized repeat protein (TIGR01451 family)|nr:DUF11 domain-containing protein [Isosphaeraceae bacterium]
MATARPLIAIAGIALAVAWGARLSATPPDDDPPRVEAPAADPKVPVPADDPTSPPPPDELAERPKKDENVELVGQGAEPAEPNILPAEGLKQGPQSVGVTVEVQAPSVVNLKKETTLRILVRNHGKADAAGVVVRDVLPEGVEFLRADPTPSRTNGPALTWQLGNLPAGNDRVIKLMVRPTVVAPFDHAATVTMMAGARSRTVVKQPRLRIEQTAAPAGGKVLKGQSVRFNISVSNPGNGTVHDVVVQAKLSPGLKHPQGLVVEQPLLDPIGPGETVALAPLVVEAAEGGEQRCEFLVRSPDVADDAPEAHAAQAVSVTEPKLKLTLVGPPRRYTDTPAHYALRVENPGTADARNVRITVFLPRSGQLYHKAASATGATWDRVNRRLSWLIPRLEPKGSKPFEFKVMMGGIQRYQIDAEATAEGALRDKGSVTTDVVGLADVRFDVEAEDRAMDVGETTEFQVVVKNHGSKDATGLLLSAKLSSNLKAVEFDSNLTDKGGKYDPQSGAVLFPQVDRLAPGATMTLTIKVEATKPGLATCQVHLVHADLGDEKLVREAITRVMDAGEAPR